METKQRRGRALIIPCEDKGESRPTLEADECKALGVKVAGDILAWTSEKISDLGFSKDEGIGLLPRPIMAF